MMAMMVPCNGERSELMTPCPEAGRPHHSAVGAKLEGDVHVYIKAKKGRVWTVGFYQPPESATQPHYRWRPLRKFDHEDSAAAYVNYLNGGKGDFLGTDLR
jgi:hypothetical protein